MAKNKCISVYLEPDMLKRVDDYIDGINSNDKWGKMLSYSKFINKLLTEFFVKLEGAKDGR